MNLIAGNIDNLTDARYFAAIGAHALIYKNIVDPSKVKEIADWVSGPEAWIEFVTDSVPELNTDIFSHLVLNPSVFSNYSELTVVKYTDKSQNIGPEKLDRPCILDFELDVDFLDNISVKEDSSVYISISHNSMDILTLVGSRGLPFGYYVEGSMEDRVGLKSYEKIDKLLEALY